jgi:hypothetical protein
MNKEKHPLENTLQNLKDFKEELSNYSAPENLDGWSLSNLPSHFWETIGECINDIEQHIKTKQYKVMNDKSKNGKLIEEIITNYVNENIFEPTNEFKESLQENLNSILKFETKVNDIGSKNKFVFGTVNFINEDGVNSVMNFTIVNSGTIVNSDTE